MHIYRLTKYHDDKREIVTVLADTAKDAVFAAAKTRNLASLTARHQRANDEAVRDNAYGQADRSGHRRWIAERIDALTLLQQLDAKSDELWGRGFKNTGNEHAEFDTFMRDLCGMIPPADNSALAAAGYAKEI